jgi:hypothetical protein
MADFDALVPEIRNDFDTLEDTFLAEAETVRKGTRAEKSDFMESCFHRALQATEGWIARLRARTDLAFEDPAYRAMWQKLNGVGPVWNALLEMADCRKGGLWGCFLNTKGTTVYTKAAKVYKKICVLRVNSCPLC